MVYFLCSNQDTQTSNVYRISTENLVGEAWDESDPLAQYTQPFDTKFNFTFAQDLVEAVKREQAIAESYDTGNTEILGFYRKNKQEKLLVLHNFSGETVTMDCSMEGGGKVIYGSKQKDTKKVRLEAFESVILQVE